MKILMLNTYDAHGGAARTATRLHHGLRGLGVSADMLVHFKTVGTSGVICRGGQLRNLARRLKLFLGLLPVRMYRNRAENNFSPALVPDRVPGEIARLDPDITHLHWLGAGFLSIETIGRLLRPIVWTLHDSWAFTGGCHMPYDCTKYREQCGSCPVLDSSHDNDLSRRVWQRKRAAWQQLDLTLVTPSRWLADCALSSALFHDRRIEVIPNGLDTELFQPGDRARARRQLGLAEDRKIVLFGAIGATTDPNKGFPLLARALQSLGRQRDDTMAVLFGSSDPLETDLGMPTVSLGRVMDDQRLSTIYAAADAFVLPSLQENLPNMLLEAMACGLPCVAFRQGGVPDLIEHRVSGYLAEPYDVEDLASGLDWVLADGERMLLQSISARQKILDRFSLQQMAQCYVDLYQDILGT